ncbi:MAG: GH36-type glycosyl hydrolase domain-containing protein, partial [Oscillospiraceae bacterium]
SGNKAFIDEVIPFANGGEGTVYEHLKRAIMFSMERLGPHKLPAGLHADWNDCLRLGAKGETTFVAFQLYYALTIMREYAVMKNDNEYIAYLDSVQKDLGSALENCWEGDRFIRGIRENGVVVGSKNDTEANIWLEPQCWSVISGFAGNDKGTAAMDSVDKLLNTKYGARVMAPSYYDHAFDGALMQCFNGSTKENGGIFSQPQGWVILAESLLGRGDMAYKYFRESSPACMNDNAEIRVIEPYAHGQFTESVESPFEGRSHVHWLTGTGSTVMVGCVEGILGMRPDADGLKIDPAISSSWKEVKIRKNFRKKKLNIVISNPNGNQSGVKSLTLNGKALDGNYIPASELSDTNEIVVTL